MEPVSVITTVQGEVPQNESCPYLLRVAPTPQRVTSGENMHVTRVENR